LPTATAHDRVAAAAARDATGGYLDSRRAQIAYAQFHAAGYPIGSGMVESANKLVVEARLKGSGMHRAAGHVDAMLGLRTLACVDRWGEAWPQIVAQQRAAATRHREMHHQRQRPSAVRASLAMPPPRASPRPRSSG